MKRNFKLLVAVVVLVAIVMTLASCEFINGIWDKINPQPHEHTFVDGVCTECQAADPDYTPACTEHAFTVETTKAPTCTEAGEKTLTCTACGHSEKQPVAALGHTETKLDGKAPTCTETGLSEGKKCTTCGVTTVEQTTIDVTSHSFVEGECTACHAADPNYTGPKTYEWTYDLYDWGDAPADKTEIPNGTTFVNGYFTVVGKVYSRVNKSGEVYCVELDKQEKGALQFTVTGTATVEINVASTSSSNTSWIAILDAEGNIVANNEGADRVTGTGDGLTLTYNLLPGTYRVVSTDTREPVLDADGNPTVDEEGNTVLTKDELNRATRLFYVKVTETPLAKIDVESAASGYVDWDTKHTFTAEKAGTYTFFVPAGLGMCTETKGEVDFFGNDNGDTLVVYLKEGETLEYVLGAKLEATGPWTIGWACVEGDPTPDGSADYPFKWETLPENVTVVQNNTYYTFTATATGTITFTWPENLNANYIEFCELDADGNPVGTAAEDYYKPSFKFAVEEGKTYRVQLYTDLWGVNVTEADVITIAFTACAHSWSEATCSVPATCATCGCTKGETLAHTPGAAATCTTNQVCTECDEVIDYAHHTWDYDNSVVVPANCATETNGTETTPCKYCDEKNVRDLWWEHTTVIDSHTDATCTTDGYHKEHCSVEGCTYSFEETLYASGHYSNDILDCEQEGTCASCGEKFIKQHDTSVYPATCTTAAKCWMCEEFIGDALGHDWVDGVCSECEAECEHTYENGLCSVCGQTDPDHYFVMTNTEALAADKGTKVQVTGVVTKIATAWSTKFNNISVTITDTEGKTLYIFRLATRVALGDTITVKGVVDEYDGSKQIGAGATATVDSHDDTYNYNKMTISDALAAEDGTNVSVSGTVCNIGTAYNSGKDNISVTIVDAEGNKIYIYQLSGEVKLHDVITVEGTMGTYNGRQITKATFEKTGATECTFAPANCESASKCTVCSAVAEGSVALGHDYDATTGICTREGCDATKPASIVTFTKATSVAAGDKVVLASESKSHQLTGFSTSSTIYGTVATYETAPADICVLTVELVKEGVYALKTEDGKYLTWTSGNSLKTSDTISDNSSWTITFSEGNAIIKNYKDSTRQLQYNYNNGSNSRFACYTSVQVAVQLYTRTETAAN